MASFITSNKVTACPHVGLLVIVCFALAAAAVNASAQRVAVITPGADRKAISFADKLTSDLSPYLRVLDRDLANSAYRPGETDTPFNLTSERSRSIGAAIGCDAFILVRAATQRRSAFGRDEYYEAYAVVYVVSSRTGHLVLWTIISRDDDRPTDAEAKLLVSTGQLARDISAKVRETVSKEIDEPAIPPIEEIPDENSPLAKDFRAPIPYLRLKPEYTPQAAFYEVAATVEALVDLDAAGKVTRVEITRWAGFGLDGSVEAAIRKMNWRPAERNGKPLPMRFLLRYNFKKLDKDPPER